MTQITKPDIDTDFQQLSDAAELQNRRATDNPDCADGECVAITVLERRLDRHRSELNAMARNLQQNTLDTKEILEIVTKGKNFFSVMDWIGTKIVGVATLAGIVTGFIFWLKPGGKP